MARIYSDDFDSRKNSAVNRRGFVVGAGATVLSINLMKSSTALGSSANTKVKLGLIGSGGRGTWISRLFMQHGGYEIVAAADYFSDRVEAYGERYEVPSANRFSGMAAHEKLLEKDVDAVAIETPPYFHPRQAEDAVDAGVHVYLAKPIAVDVPGCKTIEKCGKKAAETHLCFLVDFQTRADEFYKEALRRVHDGEIGRLAFGESTYHAGCPWKDQFKYLKDDPNDPENRLRAWGLDRVLSGDIITEQNIHTLDVASWILDREPLRAWGTCARKVREDMGNCHDCFTVTLEYPNNVGIAFSSRQFEGYGSPGGINNRMFGSRGVLETQYGGQVIIRGENPYDGGNTKTIFSHGAANNIAAFHEKIINGNYENSTVEPSVRSNLVTILGRTAAYTGEVVYWDEMLKRNEKLDANLKGLKG